MIQYKEKVKLDELYPVLNELPSDLIDAVTDYGKEVQIPAGTVVFDKASPCNGFFLLLSGIVRVSILTQSGREILLYRLQPGQSCILTVSCLLARSYYPARGIAEEDITAIEISKDLFDRLMHGSSRFREFVFRVFSQRITQFVELLEEVAIRKLDQRLASILLTKGDTIKETHQMLADELGSVREVVSRTLKSFEEMGILQLGRGKIHILNRSHLKEISLPLSDRSHRHPFPNPL